MNLCGKSPQTIAEELEEDPDVIEKICLAARHLKTSESEYNEKIAYADRHRRFFSLLLFFLDRFD